MTWKDSLLSVAMLLIGALRSGSVVCDVGIFLRTGDAAGLDLSCLHGHCDYFRDLSAGVVYKRFW
jgi:hypothetical protein